MDAVQITQLREATAADHEAVEAAVPIMAADLSPALYRRTLERLYGLVAPWEKLVVESAPVRLQTLLAERSRLHLLASDLAILGTDAQGLPLAKMPELQSSAEFLGAMYVIEGSRLGGQLLASHVERVLGELGFQSSRYLRGFGSATGLKWRQFIEVLEAEIPEAEAQQAIRSAQQTFRLFGAWMRELDSVVQDGRRPLTSGAMEAQPR